MANMTYTIGTVSVAADSTDVTGTGTLWESVNARAWDWISIDGGAPILIAEIIDTTHLKLAWPAPAEKTNVAYFIYQRSPLRFAGGQAMADVSELIALLRSRGLLWYLDPAYNHPSEANPPLVADDGQGMLQIATGKLWVMQGGAWQDAGIFKGINPRGTWNEIDTFQANDLVSDGGGSYLALAANTNDPPPSANWMLIAAKGDVGATGAPGADGTDGVDGAAATIAVGTVTTVPYGTPASVTNVGTPAAAVFDFGIPKGQDGTGTGDMQAANNLSDLANADTALGNLGGTAVGKAVFTAVDQAAAQTAIGAKVLAGHLYGMEMTWVSGAAIGFSAGECADSSAAHYIKAASAIAEKYIHVAWAAGTAQGMLDTGSVADGTYHIFAIGKSTDAAAFDYLASTSPTVPTMPATWDLKRRIGSIIRKGAALLRFTQDGDSFFHYDPVDDAQAVAYTTTDTYVALTVPTGIRVRPLINIHNTNVNAANISWVNGDGMLTQSTNVGSIVGGGPPPTSIMKFFFTHLRTDVLGRLLRRSSSTVNNPTYSIGTFGWIDTRGRLAE